MAGVEPTLWSYFTFTGAVFTCDTRALTPTISKIVEWKAQQKSCAMRRILSEITSSSSVLLDASENNWLALNCRVADGRAIIRVAHRY